MRQFFSVSRMTNSNFFIKCAYDVAVLVRFFVDSNITGYGGTFAANYFFFPSAAVLFRGRCNRANIARLQKFASTIKRTFRRYIRWIFKLLSWCDVCSIICFVKLNRRSHGKIVLRKYACARVFFSRTNSRIPYWGKIVAGDFEAPLWEFVPTFIFLWKRGKTGIVREWCRVDQSKCTDGRNARGGKSNIIVEREW